MNKPVTILASLILIGLFAFRWHAHAADPPPASWLGQPQVPATAFADPKTPTFQFNSNLAALRLESGNNACKKYACFLTLYDEHGEVVRISMSTGTVTLAHPEKLDDTSRRFWQSLSKAFNQLKCNQ